MTYRELLAELNAIATADPTLLDCDLTVYAVESDEFMPAQLGFTESDDVLDVHHPIIFCNL